MDVYTTATTVLESCRVYKVPLNAFGPLGQGLSALLVGRSSVTLQGIFVHPGVIDADFTGQISAMVSTPTPPVTIPERTRIAQLVPFKSCVPRTEQRIRGDGGFGSTGIPQIFWTADISSQKPQMTCTVVMPNAHPPRIQLRGLIDTGADVTIVSLSAWPPTWPLAPAGTAIAGLGGTTQSYLSQQPVLVKNAEGQTATVRPYVTAAPLNLWGRDVLAAWGVRIGTHF